MNDYELIYLIQTYHDEQAFDYMFLKYERFIWKIIHILHIEYNEQDDFYQEGLLMLHKAALTFQETFNKTFTKYFELILKRRYYQLIKKTPKLIIIDEKYFQDLDQPKLIEEPMYTFRHDKEQRIYTLYFQKQIKVAIIARAMDLTHKQVYNLIYRVKQIIKSYD